MPNRLFSWVKSLFASPGMQGVNLKAGVVDDHELFRKGICILLESFGYHLVLQGINGKDVINKIDPADLPDIVLMDANMPGMDGFATTFWLKENHPTVKVIGMGIENDEKMIIKFLMNGASSYLLKQVDPQELHTAIQAVYKKGFYNSSELFKYNVKYKGGSSA